MTRSLFLLTIAIVLTGCPAIPVDPGVDPEGWQNELCPAGQPVGGTTVRDVLNDIIQMAGENPDAQTAKTQALRLRNLFTPNMGYVSATNALDGAYQKAQMGDAEKWMASGNELEGIN